MPDLRGELVMMNDESVGAKIEDFGGRPTYCLRPQTHGTRESGKGTCVSACSEGESSGGGPGAETGASAGPLRRQRCAAASAENVKLSQGSENLGPEMARGGNCTADATGEACVASDTRAASKAEENESRDGARVESEVREGLKEGLDTELCDPKIDAVMELPSKSDESRPSSEVQGYVVPDQKLFCFFASQGKRVGWVLARKLGGKKVLAYSPKKVMLPPESGWQIRTGGAFEADSLVLERKELERWEVIDALCKREKVRADATLAAAVEEVSGEANSGGGTGVGEADRQEGFELSMEVLNSAQVICAQMISAGGALLARLGTFEAILVDEVAQVHLSERGVTAQSWDAAHRPNATYRTAPCRLLTVGACSARSSVRSCPSFSVDARGSCSLETTASCLRRCSLRKRSGAGFLSRSTVGWCGSDWSLFSSTPSSAPTRSSSSSSPARSTAGSSSPGSPARTAPPCLALHGRTQACRLHLSRWVQRTGRRWRGSRNKTPPRATRCWTCSRRSLPRVPAQSPTLESSRPTSRRSAPLPCENSAARAPRAPDPPLSRAGPVPAAGLARALPRGRHLAGLSRCVQGRREEEAQVR